MGKLYKDRDWLWEHYIVREESTAVMAKAARCSPTTISNWLYELNISIHDRDNLWQDRDWLYEHYIVREESSYVMAKEAKCAPSTIRRWLLKMDIPVRNLGEAVFLAQKNSVIITPNLLKFMKGEILGDGHVGMTSNRSACYRHTSKYEEYLIWLSKCYAGWGIEQSGRITDHKDKETDAIYYHYNSKSYPELVPFVKEWYSKRDGKMKKTTVPKDLELTPTMIRQWYIGDGCLKHSERSRPYINLATCDFDYPSVNYLIGELGKLGFKATYQRCDNTINISAYSTEAFLAWIGPCPIPCYDYKWEYEKRT